MSPRSPRAAVCAATVVAIGLVGCAPRATDPSTAPPAPQLTTSPPQAVQHRAYACGSTVAPPVEPSTAGDPVRLSVTGVRLHGDRVTARYEISSAHTTTVLTYPVSPTPPTILLMRAGHIVGRHEPPASSVVDGRPAEMRPIGRHPYVSSLTVDAWCPGTTAAQVRSHPARYRAEIVMSVQPTGGPQTAPPARYLPDPLTSATARLTR
ncbi:hypothetical protein [Streptomyces gilvus]|uniref:hypothetical protein n=1 Tax=Streptomyces gilvus TaxID=2920937 RepID=UPI001F0FFB53|nr:hypothetical protein [Streptomyces sp. CME 23]MCH5676273.1 hypothetical protein [Streptomyces sp. CME 23]